MIGLTENHVKKFFGAILYDVSNSNGIKEILKDMKDRNFDNYPVHLTELLKEVEKWNIKPFKH